MMRQIIIGFLLFIIAVPEVLAQQEPPTPRRPRRPRRDIPVIDPLSPPTASNPPPPATAVPPDAQPVTPPTAPPPTATVTAPPPGPGGAATSLGGEAPGEDSELYKCRAFKASDRIKVTLKPDTDLKDLVAWVMGFTCKSFIFGNAISGRASKVTIIAPSMMSPQDAYRLFLVGLQTMNLTIVPKGNTLEIVESQRGREMPLPVYKSGRAVPGQDQIVRLVLRPSHVTPDELSQVLNAMKTGTGTVTPIATAGVLIVTDYGSTIDKMMDVVKEVDAQTGAEKIYIIYLTNADAQDVQQKLEQIFGTGRAAGPAAPAPQIQAPQPGQAPRDVRRAAQGGGGGGGSAAPSKIIADTRTNSLIVIASERAYQRILALVRRLDAGGPTETGSIHVYALSNADAETLAGTMNTLITGQAPPRPVQPGQPGQQQPRNVPAAVQQQATGGSIAGTGAFEGTIKLTHDKPTNSLVIVSSPKDFFSLREVIRKLDLPRRQVFVECSILEVAINKGRKIGFSYHGGDQISTENGDVTIIGGVESAALSSLNPLASAGALDGLIGGVIGPQIPGLSIPSIGVLFQLVQTNNEVNVLSTPNLLTTDNEPAEISVGQNIPYQSTTFAGLPALAAAQGQQGQAQTPLSGLAGLGQSIQRQDVALTLKLTPHVSEADIVRLEVDLEISDVLPEQGALGPTWSKRRVKTPIVVKDQQSVVIGGLISDRLAITETKVPILGDIPLLGYLFRYSDNRRIKVNLLIFLTPYVVRDQTDIQRIYEQKVREQEEFMKTFSSLVSANFDPDVNYARKRGLLEEINQSVRRLEDDDKILRDADEAARRRGQEGPIEIPDENTPKMPPEEKK